MHSCLRLSAMALTFLCLNSLWAQTEQQYSLYYETDQYAIEQHQSEINAIAAKVTPDMYVRIYGYTDAVGTTAYNQQLAYQRAKTLADALEKAGVSNRQMTFMAVGENNPIGDNAVADGRSKNRRVDVLIAPASAKVEQVLDAYLPKAQLFTIDPNKPNIITIGTNGTTLTVPANAFTDANGNIVTTPVTIEFTEYTTTGDILFSNIPMTYSVDGAEQRMSSAGMFNIQGNANGKPIEIGDNSALTINYAMSNMDDVDYYALNEQNKWEKISDITPVTEQEDASSTAVKPVITVMNRDISAITNTQDLFVDVAIEAYNDQAGTNYTENDFNQNTQEELKKMRQEQLKNYTKTTSANKTITDGLSISKFGVYNCDQIALMRNPVSFTAQFVDEENDPLLFWYSTIYVVDVFLNASFQFGAGGTISIDKSGKTIFIAITDKGEIYVGDNYNSYKTNLKANTENTIKLVNKTEQLASAKALNAYLKTL